MSARAPQQDLDRVDAAHQRFVHAIADVDDERVRGPSLLPGWTVAHVLSHVARNADSHRRRAAAAARGTVIDQYPGGYAGRAAEIDAGAARTATELRDDVLASGEAMRTAWREVPDGSWGMISRDVGGQERPLHTLPARRWQELEVHVVDLDVGVRHRGWPSDFVAVWLPKLRESAAARLPAGASLPGPGVLDERDELAWLYGRWARSDLPVLAPWR